MIGDRTTQDPPPPTPPPLVSQECISGINLRQDLQIISSTKHQLILVAWENDNNQNLNVRYNWENKTSSCKLKSKIT